MQLLPFTKIVFVSLLFACSILQGCSAGGPKLCINPTGSAHAADTASDGTVRLDLGFGDAQLKRIMPSQIVILSNDVATDPVSMSRVLAVKGLFCLREEDSGIAPPLLRKSAEHAEVVAVLPTDEVSSRSVYGDHAENGTDIKEFANIAKKILRDSTKYKGVKRLTIVDNASKGSLRSRVKGQLESGSPSSPLIFVAHSEMGIIKGPGGPNDTISLEDLSNWSNATSRPIVVLSCATASRAGEIPGFALTTQRLGIVEVGEALSSLSKSGKLDDAATVKELLSNISSEFEVVRRRRSMLNAKWVLVGTVVGSVVLITVANGSVSSTSQDDKKKKK